MSSNDRGYMSRSWELLTRNEGWYKPLLILAAARLVPVVGSFGANGYGLEWARLTAWGVDSSPKQKNVDIWACIKSGARAFVVGLGYGVVLAFLRLLLTSVLGPVLGGLLGTIVLIVGIVIAMVAKLRATIYQTIGAGYQLDRIYDMAKRDHKGLLRILGMFLLLGMGFCLIAGTLYGVVLVARMGRWMGELMEYVYYDYGYGDDWYIISTMLLAFAAALPTLFVMSYFVGIIKSAVNLLEVTAVGLWMRQFDVPDWGESSDPLPADRPVSSDGYGVSSAGSYASGQGYGTTPSPTAHDASEPVKAQVEEQVQAVPIPVPIDDFPMASPADDEVPTPAEAEQIPAEPESWTVAPAESEDIPVEPEPFTLGSVGEEDAQQIVSSLEQTDEPEEPEAPAEPVSQTWEVPAEPIVETWESSVEPAIETQEVPVEPEVEPQEELAEVPLFPLVSMEADQEPVEPAVPGPSTDESLTQEQLLAQVEAAVAAADMTAVTEEEPDEPAEPLALEVPQDENVRPKKASSDERIIEVIDLTGGTGVHKVQPDDEQDEQ